MEITRWRARPAADAEYTLAEGPVWDGPRDRLLWVEIEAGKLHAGRLHDDHIEPYESWTLDRTVSAVAPGRTGDLLVAGTETLLILGSDGEVTPGPRILEAGSGRRLNDGECDPDGVFWVGTMRFDEEPGGETLVRVGAGGEVTVVDEGLSLSNGLGWSPDGSVFYSTDTEPRIVYARARPDGARREFLRPASPPDGLCVDASGNLWIAQYGAGEVLRYAPDGTLTGVVEVGEAEVTCPAFAGPGLDRLVITTRSGLWLADVGATGLPVNQWAGF